MDEQIKLDREGPSVVGSKGPAEGHRLNLGLILEGCAYIRTHAEQQTIAIVHDKYKEGRKEQETKTPSKVEHSTPCKYASFNIFINGYVFGISKQTTMRWRVAGGPLELSLLGICTRCEQPPRPNCGPRTKEGGARVVD